MLSTLTALHGPVWFGEAELTKKYTLNEKKSHQISHSIILPTFTLVLYDM